MSCSGKGIPAARGSDSAVVVLKPDAGKDQLIGAAVVADGPAVGLESLPWAEAVRSSDSTLYSYTGNTRDGFGRRDVSG